MLDCSLGYYVKVWFRLQTLHFAKLFKLNKLAKPPKWKRLLLQINVAVWTLRSNTTDTYVPAAKVIKFQLPKSWIHLRLYIRKCTYICFIYVWVTKNMVVWKECSFRCKFIRFGLQHWLAGRQIKYFQKPHSTYLRRHILRFLYSYMYVIFTKLQHIWKILCYLFENLLCCKHWTDK